MHTFQPTTLLICLPADLPTFLPTSVQQMPWYQYQYPAEDPYYNQYQYPKMKTDTDSKLDTYTNTYNQKLLYYNFFPRLWDNFKNEEDLENKIIF